MNEDDDRDWQDPEDRDEYIERLIDEWRDGYDMGCNIFFDELKTGDEAKDELYKRPGEK